MKLKQYLVACEENDYQPWITKPSALAAFSMITLSLRLILPATLSFAAGTIDSQDLMNKINLERTQRFLQPLLTNDKLISAATGKAQDMLNRSYFAHIDPDGNYVWPRIEAAGYTPYLTLGENLAMDFFSADAVIAAWMNSPTHRANIVNDKFQDQGLSSIYGTFAPNHETNIVVSLFGALYVKPISTSQPKIKAAPAPAPKTKPPVPLPPIQKPPPTAAAPALHINNDIKISTTSISGNLVVDLNVVITGQPTLVTAQLKGQSINLLAGTVSGNYIGKFTFDQSTEVNAETLSVTARDKAGQNTSTDFTLNNIPPPSTGPLNSFNGGAIPTSPEVQFLHVLRIIFAGLALLYVVFLLIDSIIIHRAKVARTNMHSSTHILLLLLIAGLNLFITWF